MKLPIARTIELIEQEADKELLIYDLRINKAYTLNETSKTVFKACNGKTSFDSLKREYNYTDDLIYLTLDELKKNDLIQADYASPFVGISRREVIRKVGLASMIALPVISTLIAPQAAHAASSCTPGPNAPGTQTTTTTSCQSQVATVAALKASCQSCLYRDFTATAQCLANQFQGYGTCCPPGGGAGCQ